MKVTDAALDRLGALLAEDNAPLGLVLDARYEVTARLARGGMGEIFRADDRRLRREVAIKVLSAALSTPSWTDRFRAEALTMTRIDHPGVVPIHDLGVLPDGRAWYAMKFIEGRTLDAALVSGADRKALVRLLIQAATVVQHAHERSIIHRDLKPANVMIGANDQVYVLDWGIAKVRDEFRLAVAEEFAAAPGQTGAGVVMGTLEYMPPEQARGESTSIDARSDVYALGAVLYEILTGRPPVRGPRETALLLKAQTGVVKPPRERKPGVPADLDAICMKALARSPAARYPTARAFAEDLRRWLEGDAVQARRPSLLHRTWKRALRHRTLSIVSAAAVLAVGAFAFYWAAHREDTSLASAKRLEDDVLGPVRARIGQLPETAEGRERKLQVLEEAARRAPGSWELRLWRAETQEGLRKFMAALASYGEALDRNPRLSVARYRRGVILARHLDRAAESAAEFEAVLRIDPGNEYAMLARAQNAVGERKYQEALEVCDEVERIARHQADLHYVRGIVRMDPAAPPSIHDPKRALEDLDAALRLDPRHTAALGSRSVIKARLGDLEGAVADNTRALEIDPDSLGALANRGMDLTELGRLDEAIVDFDRAIRINPGEARSRVGRSIAHFRASRFREALADADRAVALAPKLSAAYVVRSRARRESGDGPGARTDAIQATTLRPDSSEAHREVGILAGEDGSYETAANAYARAIELDPRDALAHFNRGVVLERLGDPASAEKSYSGAIGAHAAYREAWLNRGLLRADRDDLDGALSDLDRAIEIDPKHAQGYANRGLLRHQRGDAAGALADLDRAVELDPKYPVAWSNRGLALQRKGDLAGAERDQTRAIELDPTFKKFWNNRAMVRRQRKDFDGCIADCTKALELDAAYPLAYANRAAALGAKGDKEGARRDFRRALDILPAGSPLRTSMEHALKDLND